MPKTGTSEEKIERSTAGAPAAYTDEGPPERINAAGLRASISATGIVCGTISEWTRASRTRRAMSWAYWAPKSTTRTRSCSASAVARDMTAAYPRTTAAPPPDAPQGPADQGARPGPGSGLPEQRRGMGHAKGREFAAGPDPSTTSRTGSYA